jgi:hypothetical protein
MTLDPTPWLRRAPNPAEVAAHEQSHPVRDASGTVVGSHWLVVSPCGSGVLDPEILTVRVRDGAIEVWSVDDWEPIDHYCAVDRCLPCGVDGVPLFTRTLTADVLTLLDRVRELEAERDAERSSADRLRAERNAMYSASDLGRIADDLDEDNHATDAAHVRAAIVEIDRLESEGFALRSVVGSLPVCLLCWDKGRRRVATGIDIDSSCCDEHAGSGFKAYPYADALRKLRERTEKR